MLARNIIRYRYFNITFLFINETLDWNLLTLFYLASSTDMPTFNGSIASKTRTRHFTLAVRLLYASYRPSYCVHTPGWIVAYCIHGIYKIIIVEKCLCSYNSNLSDGSLDNTITKYQTIYATNTFSVRLRYSSWVGICTPSCTSSTIHFLSMAFEAMPCREWALMFINCTQNCYVYLGSFASVFFISTINLLLKWSSAVFATNKR